MLESMRQDKRTGKQFCYLLDALYNSETGEAFANDFDAVFYMWHKFNEEFNNDYNRKLYPKLSDRVGEWFAGLPSGVGIAFTYADIIEVGRSWGYCKNEKQAIKFCEDWFRVLGLRFVQMVQKLGLC